MKITNFNNGILLADRAVLATSFTKRLIGLLKHKSLAEGEALILKPSNSIHTFFMRFSIGVLFLDRDNKVIAAYDCIKPFRLSPVYFNALSVVEFPAGIINKTGIKKGDLVSFSE